MKNNWQKSVCLLFLLLAGSFNLIAQNPQPPVPRIVNLSGGMLQFCRDSVFIMPQISIQNVEIDEASEGMKISVINYRKDEDMLGYIAHAKFSYRWDNYYGILFITGIGTSSEYEEAIRNVYYKNLAQVPDLRRRAFVASLLDADYLPATGHFYRFVRKLDVSWKEARDAADTMSYYGLKGYLTTITSSEENDFIWTKIDGVGWIGASDEEMEGEWKWVTGPEKGQIFWRGNSYGQSVNGMFSFWASGEPNNAGSEQYAHINQNPDKAPKSWNDLRNEGNGPASQYYRARGFIVEFGGMPGESQLMLTAYVEMEISKIAFSNERFFEICEGTSKKLNVDATNLYNFSWTPSQDISNPGISNPVVSPKTSTIYRAVGKLGTCTDTAFFDIKVNPAPVFKWKKENTICKGTSIVLNPGEYASYLWGNGENSKTRTVSAEGWNKVKLTNEFGCSKTDSTLVKWSKKPVIDFGKLDTLVCGQKSKKVSLAFKEGTAAVNVTSAQANATILNPVSLSPTIEVASFGNYRFFIDMVDEHQCAYSDSFSIGFHNQPDAKFQLDEAKCKGYNLKLNFNGIRVEDALFNWYSSDTLFHSEINRDSFEIPLGFGARNRSVGLLINEQGCTDSFRLPVTVTPNINFWPVENEGCTPFNVRFDYLSTEEVDSFYWDFGDSNFSVEAKPKHLYQNKGVADLNFDVRLKVISSEGCENTGILKDTITVHPIHSVDFDFSESTCYPALPNKVYYAGSATAKDSFIWDLNDFGQGEILVQPENSPGPLVFSRTLDPTVKIGLKVISEFGCESQTFYKPWKRKPLFKVEILDTAGCAPFTSQFKAITADTVDFTWDFGDGGVADGENTAHLFTVPDRKIDVEIIANSLLTQCSDTLVLKEKIFSYPLPVAAFTAEPNEVLISNPMIQFENKSNGSSLFEWNFGDDSFFSEEENPRHIFSGMGYFDVQLTAINDLGCTDSAMQRVAVAFDKVYPPNAFSPNSIIDENKEFRVYAPGIIEENYKLQLFNRWGELIFESHSQQTGWDGRMKNGNFAPAGAYTWVLDYLDFQNKKHRQSGAVTLLF